MSSDPGVFSPSPLAPPSFPDVVPLVTSLTPLLVVVVPSLFVVVVPSAFVVVVPSAVVVDVDASVVAGAFPL